MSTAIWLHYLQWCRNSEHENWWRTLLPVLEAKETTRHNWDIRTEAKETGKWKSTALENWTAAQKHFKWEAIIACFSLNNSYRTLKINTSITNFCKPKYIFIPQLWHPVGRFTKSFVIQNMHNATNSGKGPRGWEWENCYRARRLPFPGHSVKISLHRSDNIKI